MELIEYIYVQSNIDDKKISAVLKLIEEGGTLAFIVRYRQDEIGGLDEKQVGLIIDLKDRFISIEKRKTAILKLLIEKKIDNKTLIDQIRKSYNLVEIEELYAPYKKKSKTKAQIARDEGLEPFFRFLYFQNKTDLSREEIIEKYFLSNSKLKKDEILEYALELIKEAVILNSKIKDIARKYINRFGVLKSKKKKGFVGDDSKYKDYLDYRESINRLASHRVLAIWRAEKEGVVSKKIEIEFDELYERVFRYFKIDEFFIFSDELIDAVKSAVKKSIFKSIEKEIFAELFQKAQDSSLELYAKNLEYVLLQAPAGEKIVLGIDPGFKNGCKCVILDKHGNILHLFKFSLFQEKNAIDEIDKLIFKYKVELIIVGDGTASKESFKLVKDNFDIPIVVGSESGASIYSVSKKADEEFGDIDVLYRGAISIARRVQDPLSELVKLDPKTLGVGQYQYDLNAKKLQKTLDDVVVSCVNKVGADVNTAGFELLSFISGLTSRMAKNIINYRKENVKIKNRNELKKIKGIGAKAFENSAGFLVINNADNILDMTNIHPESYDYILKALGNRELTWENLRLLSKEDFSIDIGAKTIDFILGELNKTKRDPRDMFRVIDYNYSINSINDIKVGDIYKGKVKNITDFGAFIDIGIKTNGLLHKSKYRNKLFNIGEVVDVEIIDIDLERKRISLNSMF